MTIKESRRHLAFNDVLYKAYVGNVITMADYRLLGTAHDQRQEDIENKVRSAFPDERTTLGFSILTLLRELETTMNVPMGTWDKEVALFKPATD